MSAQKATLGTGACLLGAASVLQCHGVLLFRNRPLGGRCGAALRAWELHFGAGFLSAQKATLGTGACLLGAASVLQCHGVLLFRNRPLGGRCGAVLRAWELHFEAGFLSVQKATLGTGACLLGAASVLQCHGVLLFRNRPLGGRCGAALKAWELHFGAGFLLAQEATLGTGACLPEPPAGTSLWSCFERAWELHFGAGFLSAQKATLGTGACLLGAASVLQCHGVLLFPNRISEPLAGTSLWSCFEGMGAALWSWFLVGSEGNVRHWSLLARRRFHPSVPWCFAVSQPPAGRSLWSCFERAWELHFGAGVHSVASKLEVHLSAQSG